MAKVGGGADVPEEYEGREQAYIKHELLKAYLEKLFLIVGMSSRRVRIPEICYVDCFAGPWSTESENLADTSIGVSLRILERCKKELDRQGLRLRFRALYVEEDDQAFARLDQFLKKSAPPGIGAQAFHGDFFALREKILKWCGSEAFTFFFVDPTGWKEVAVEVLRPLLQRPRSEFLINFMYDFVSRTASMASWQEEIAALLGEAVTVENLHGASREKVLVDTYRKNLKRELPASEAWPARSAHVRVLDRQRERPKYHLVYLTTHPRGIVEFMEISEGLDQVQKRVRASTRQAMRVRKSKQEELFDESELINPDAGHVNLAEVERYWIGYLSAGEKRVGVEEFANILEETDWFPGDLQRALGRLIEAGTVRNLDAKRKRPKQPLHWKEGERLALIKPSP
jgi:three-Cys-motif partner protein